MVRCFDKLTTNGIKNLPFVLSLSKDLFRVSISPSFPIRRVRAIYFAGEWPIP